MFERKNPILVVGVLSLGMFMTLLDITIVNIAIPSIVSTLHAGLDEVLWVLSAYSLLYAVLLITAGRAGDIAGPRNLFAAGLGLFTVASVLSGIAQTPGQLIAARALQGVGAAVAAPQGMPIMLSLFPADKRGGVFAIYGVLGGLAVLAGPTLGGFLVTHFGWRSIFFVNVPVGIVTVLLAMAIVPDVRPGRRHRLDAAGVVLATVGLLGLVFGLIEGERYDWGRVAGPVTIPGLIAAGALVLAAFVYQQWRRQSAEPLLPFAVFRDRTFTVMTLVLAGLGFAMVACFLPLTIFLQSVLGLSAIDAGLTIAPQPLAMMVTSGIAGALVARWSAKYVLMVGLVAFAAGMAYVAWISTTGLARWDLLPGLLAAGAGLGFVWTPVFGLATRDLRPELAGVASGVVNTIQELGALLGSAVAGAVLQHRLAAGLHEHLAFGSAFTGAMRLTLLVPIAVVALVAAAALAARGGPAGAPAAVMEQAA